MSETDLGEDEAQETGAVSLKVYKFYESSVGHYLTVAILLSLFLMQGSKNYTDLFLANWVSKSSNSTTTQVSYYLGVYVSIAVVNSIFSFFRAFLFAFGGVQAAKVIHDRLLSVILKAKTYFVDNTSTGRILNRFSSDLYTVDDNLPFILNILLAQVFGVVGPILVCAYAVPWIILVSYLAIQ